MRAQVKVISVPQGEVTFRGRGLGVVTDSKLSLTICPLCSQRNTRQAAPRGHCQWCAYEPSLMDAEPAPRA